MKRILLSAAILLAVGAFVVIAGGATTANNQSGQYKVELDNAFGLLNGAQFKIGGVPTGAVKKVEICKLDSGAHCLNPLHAVVTVQINQKGFTQMRSDAYCRTRPESLIGEYFLDCQPGSKGKLLPFGTTIPVTHTQSTIPFDLINNIMRLPYRERFTLIINELGAAVAGRSGDLQAALRRAVPALTETDNLLNLLANDSHTLQQLTANSNTVVTALADNSRDVQHFIDEANRAAQATATQQSNLALSIHRLPPFLEQLRPAMAKLSDAVVANEPVLANLNALSPPGGHLTTSGQLARLFRDTPGFAHSSKPALQSLGQASVTGKPAVIAARPTVHHLNQFTGQTGCQGRNLRADGKANPLGQTVGQSIACLPELAQNGSIFLQDIDTQNRAVEADSRSPGGKGFSGIQALLQYVFNQPLAINAYSQFGHLLTVDAFTNLHCSPYSTPQRIANNLASDPQGTRECYSWLGPNQPGINEPDPSNPGGCVPDPGGAPPGEPGPKVSACKLQPNPAKQSASDSGSGSGGGGGSSGSQRNGSAANTSTKRGSSGSSGIDLQQKLGQIFSSLGGGAPAASSATRDVPSASSATRDVSSASAASSNVQSSPSSASQAKQLLNYLLAP